MALMARVKPCAPDGMPDADVLLQDQFMDRVLNCSLQLELKQLVRCQPIVT